MEPVQTAGIPLAGFAGDAGAAAPAAKGNLPTCRGMGGQGCPHSRRGWLGRAAQPPAPPACRGRPLLRGGLSSWPALPPSSWGAGGARTHVAHTIQTDARTPTRAHGRVPTGAEVAVAWALGLPGSRGPRLPPAASREPVPRGTARQQAGGALPAAPGSLGVPAADTEDTPSQARWALTSTGGQRVLPRHGPRETATRRGAELAALPPAGLPAGPGCAWTEPKRSPADQPEPGEAVVEGISAGHHVVAVLDDARRHFGGTVIHFTHQVQALPAGRGGMR